MSFTQYLKDTRAELNHVAWPTQTQTVVFTVLVVIVSLFIALYLGFFDYIFTTALSRVVEAVTGVALQTPEPVIEAVTATTSEPTIQILSTSTPF